jgi:hypothetical protein
MNVPEILIAAAKEVEELDKEIAKLARLAEFKGALRVVPGNWDANAIWEGEDDTITDAVKVRANIDLGRLQSKKAIVLTTLLGEIEKAVMETGAVPTEGPLV